MTAQRQRHEPLWTHPRGESRPILLATFFSVPFDQSASELAVESAVEVGVPLVVVNIVELPPLPMSVRLGFDHLEDPPDVVIALQAPAKLASSLGVQVERLLVRSPRPIAALLQLTAERRPGLLVLGSEHARLGRRFSARLWRIVCDEACCLVWRPGDGYDSPADRTAGTSS